MFQNLIKVSRWWLRFRLPIYKNVVHQIILLMPWFSKNFDLKGCLQILCLPLNWITINVALPPVSAQISLVVLILLKQKGFYLEIPVWWPSKTKNPTVYPLVHLNIAQMSDDVFCTYHHMRDYFTLICGTAKSPSAASCLWYNTLSSAKWSFWFQVIDYTTAEYLAITALENVMLRREKCKDQNLRTFF